MALSFFGGLKMARNKHTPGPWEVHEVFEHDEVISRGVRQVGGKGINTGEDFEMFSEADARLIAASPDLLKAAKSKEACRHVGPGFQAWDVLRRAAIALRADGQHSTGRALDQIATALESAVEKAEGY
jgi:hypothetical protein